VLSMRRKASREPLSLFPDTLRPCSSCVRSLPPAAFNRDRKNRDGLSSYCRECRAARKKASYPAEAAAQSARHVHRTYGVAPEALAEMAETQGNRCAICEQPFRSGKARHVDHCHVTGRVRALLCSHCNLGLGHAKDDPALLRKMADYLDRHRGE